MKVRMSLSDNIGKTLILEKDFGHDDDVIGTQIILLAKNLCEGFGYVFDETFEDALRDTFLWKNRS